MKVGITGSQGLLGSYVFKTLSEAGAQVIVLDEFTRELRSLAELPPKLDWVCHFAAKASIDRSLKDPLTTYRANFASTGIALEIARMTGASFLFMSSSVYGTPRSLPVAETHPVNVSDPYKGSKLLCESLCEHYRDLFNIPLIILRGFNIYGPKRIPGRVISDLLDNAKAKEPFVLNVGDLVRDYLWIGDFSELIRTIIETTPITPGIFNVGSGVGYSNLEIAEIFRSLTEEKCPVKIRGQRRATDVPSLIADVSKLQHTFRWKSRTSLRGGIEMLLAGLQQ